MPGPLDNLDEAIRELQDLYDDPDIVTTADKIQQPDTREDVKTIDAINAFMQRNPKADGGMLVQPGDGSRLQYNGSKESQVVNAYKILKKELGREPTRLEIADKTNVDKATVTRHAKKNNLKLTDIPKVPQDKIVDRELITTIIENSNNGNEFVNPEDISRMYAEATGQTNVTKRKRKDKIVTYKQLDAATIKLAAKNTTLGYIETKEDKVKKVFQEVLSMDGPVPKVTLSNLGNRSVSDYKKYIINETGIGLNNVEKIISSLPSYKKNKEAFKYLQKSRLVKTDLVDMSLTDQLKYAEQAAEGKPKYVNVKGMNFSNPDYVVMDYALRNWNANKGKGKIQFYDANGDKIIWKNGLDLSLNKVSFSQNKSKQRFGIGQSDDFSNIRFVGKDYFPEVYKNVALINQLKTTPVDNPFKPGTQTSFLKLMKRIYVKEKGFSAKAPLFSIFHGPGGVAKEPFKNLNFGLLDLNRAIYNIEEYVPLKGLKQKILNQAYSHLKGKSGGELIKAITDEQVNIARDIKRGKNPLEGTLRDRIFRDTLEKQSLGTRERQFLEMSLASFANNRQCDIIIRKPKADGGRIPYQKGTISLSQCAIEGAKNINEGNFKTADQAQDAAKLLGGGQKILRGLMKYGILPEAAYVAGESVFRSVLGEKPLNALKKSIDTFSFGLTDFTSGIEAKKFGQDADRKLAVDKLRESQDKVNSIQQEIANLETLNTGSQFGYEGDQTKAIQMKNVELEAAKKELQKNYINSDIVKYIDRKAENIADAQRAKSAEAKASERDQMEGIPGVADYMDTETARVFPRQPSQMELNLNMLEPLPTNFLDDTTTELFKRSQDFRDQGLKVSTRDLIDYQKALKNMSLSQLAEIYNPESIYGSQGVPSQPLAGGGIAGLSGGVDKGPAPARGPNPQGLSYLMKRAMKLKE